MNASRGRACLQLLALHLACVAIACCGACALSLSTRPVPADLMVRTQGESMIPFFADGEWVGLLLVDFATLQPYQTCVYWQNSTGQWVHHFTFRFDSMTGDWTMRNGSGVRDEGTMSRGSFLGRTVKLPKQPRFGSP